MPLLDSLSRIFTREETSPKDPRVIYGVTNRQGAGLFTQVDDWLINQSRVSLKEKAQLYSSLRLLVGSGVRFVRAVEMLADRSRNPRLQRILWTVAHDMQERGMRFSQAIAKYPEIFSEAEIKVLYAGEYAGKVEDSLSSLAQQSDKTLQLNRRVRSALMYPLTVLIAIVLAIAVVMLFVVPQFEDLFSQFGADLPPATQFMIAASSFVTQWWWAVLLGLLILWGVFSQWRASESGGRTWGKFLLELPVVRTVLQNIETTRIAQNLSTLLSSGVPVEKSLEILSGILPSPVSREAIRQVQRDVQAGVEMHQSFRAQPYLDPILAEVIEVGAQGGQIPEILHKTGDQYEQEVDAQLQNISGLIEPVVLVAVAAIVVFMAMAIMTPIFQLQNLIATG
ncbi:type II secretion system F family protein [Candidatus Peribacteria bacterium]|nr:type II secretion system F family protein [Candidatus Peribacteria bacterium]